MDIYIMICIAIIAIFLVIVTVVIASRKKEKYAEYDQIGGVSGLGWVL